MFVPFSCCVICRFEKDVRVNYLNQYGGKLKETVCPKCALKVHANRRKARLQNARAIEVHTADEWQELLRKHDFKCAKCKGNREGFSLQKDHILPISKGGHDGISNIQPLCISCNAMKRNK